MFLAEFFTSCFLGGKTVIFKLNYYFSLFMDCKFVTNLLMLVIDLQLSKDKKDILGLTCRCSTNWLSSWYSYLGLCIFSVSLYGEQGRQSEAKDWQSRETTIGLDSTDTRAPVTLIWRLLGLILLYSVLFCSTPNYSANYLQAFNQADGFSCHNKVYCSDIT